jgi:cytochrome P450
MRLPARRLAVVSLSGLDLASVDLTGPDLYANGVPHHWFARLREADPVHWHPDTSVCTGFWALTKHGDIAQVSRDPKTFSSAAGFVFIEDLEPDAMEARRSMIEMDPPAHTRLRRLVSPLFTPQAIAEYREHARTIAAGLLDRAFRKGTFDWATEVCEPMPIRVFVKIMGLEQRDAPYLARMANQLITVDDPELAPSPEAYARLRERGLEPRLVPFQSPAALDLFDFGRRVGAERRRQPREDLLTRLVNAEWDGDTLSDSEFVNFFQLLIFAGNETTRTSLQQGMLALIEHPEQLERLRADPGHTPSAVEEILRWATPIYYFRRTALADSEIRGRHIAKGDKVVMYYISGNFDEEVFDSPLRFDVMRESPGHLTFGGGGPHFCLGSWLARMQVGVMLEEFLDRGVRLELAGAPRRLRSNFTNGLKSLPVLVNRA